MAQLWQNIGKRVCVAAASLLLLVPSVCASQPDSLKVDSVVTEHLERPASMVRKQKQLTGAVDSLAVVDSLQLSAQVDSLLTQVRLQKQNQFVPDPKRALWLALVFPGAGQIYNRKYWKLPIVYGGFLGCYYALSWNNQMLRDYSQAYLDIMDDDPNTKSYEKMLPLNYNISGRESQFKEIFKNKKNYYRKYRDMSILAFAAVYAIAVIDAYVDAELSTFDISEDLSLQWSPAVISNTPAGQGVQTVVNPNKDRGFGMALRLNF